MRNFKWIKQPCFGLLLLSGCDDRVMGSPDAVYVSYFNFKVLICLFVLMLAVELFQEARLFAAIAAGLLNRVSGLS
jgi:Na+/H+ antiporter NhaD/arsenite permease-like protein